MLGGSRGGVGVEVNLCFQIWPPDKVLGLLEVSRPKGWSRGLGSEQMGLGLRQGLVQIYR
jgi:hypothetical protein